jgi:hypothetical protein
MKHLADASKNWIQLTILNLSNYFIIQGIITLELMGRNLLK